MVRMMIVGHHDRRTNDTLPAGRVHVSYEEDFPLGYMRRLVRN